MESQVETASSEHAVLTDEIATAIANKRANPVQIGTILKGIRDHRLY